MKAKFKAACKTPIAQAVGYEEEGDIVNETVTDGIGYTHVVFHVYGAEVIAKTEDLAITQ